MVTQRECRNERLFDRCGGAGEASRAACRFERDLGPGLRQHGQVVIWADGESDSPSTHRTGRVQLQSPGKGSRRLIVIECPQQAHPLIEIALRLRRGGRYPAMVRAQTLKNPGSPGPISQGRWQVDIRRHGNRWSGLRRGPCESQQARQDQQFQSVAIGERQ